MALSGGIDKARLLVGIMTEDAGNILLRAFLAAIRRESVVDLVIQVGRGNLAGVDRNSRTPWYSDTQTLPIDGASA
jgi:hypothetical protein